MHRFTRIFVGIAMGAGVGFAASATPAVAEVVQTNDDHFVTRAQAVVDASRKETWLALISPARWWSGEHTWSADAANLKLTPQAGGCFCETIPETDTPDGFTLQGSVEHMRVIQAYPEVALRMTGALGPLQSEPVTGILTIALSEVEPGEDGTARTRIVWEYNVGGKMRYPVPVISIAVDGVMTLQLTRLAEMLGPVELPEAGPAPADDDPSGDEGSEADDPATQEVLQDPQDPQDGAPTIEPELPSVDDAFDDFSSD